MIYYYNIHCTPLWGCTVAQEVQERRNKAKVYEFLSQERNYRLFLLGNNFYPL